MWNGANELNLERLVARAGTWGRALAGLGALGSLAWLGLAAGWIPLGPRSEAGRANAVAMDLDPLAADRLDKATVNKAILGKAIFCSNNREPDKVVNEVGRYELRGIFARDGVTKAAIRDTKRKKTLIKQAGDSVDTFEVVEIGADSVKLRQGSEEVSLVR